MLFKGDSLTYHLGQKFSTRDQDNDKDLSGSCAVRHKGAWWFKLCYAAHLNGVYFQNGRIDHTGVVWHSWKKSFYSLKFTEMKIKPF